MGGGETEGGTEGGKVQERVLYKECTCIIEVSLKIILPIQTLVQCASMCSRHAALR